MVLDDFGQPKISGNHRHLVRILVCVVQGVFICTSEQQDPGATFLVINGAHVKGRIPTRIAGVHIRPVEQEVLQMLY